MAVILVINAGSSSIKFSVFDATEIVQPVMSGQLENVTVSPVFTAHTRGGDHFSENLPEPGHQPSLHYLLDWLAAQLNGHRIIAVGHRVVHGGMEYTAPVILTPQVLTQLESLVPLAPLHQPHNLLAIKTIQQAWPDLPQVACFDTAFHATQLPLARKFPLPRKYTEAGIIRYGFHGLSYEYITSVLPGYAGARVIIAHLGNGASMCAVKNGKSIATTMGFTALDGLMMGTRTGAIDPGVILYFLEQKGYSLNEVNTLLYKQSGLLGVSGISHDMRELEQSGTPEAKEAIDLFCYRAAREIGSLTAALGGLDAVVFTAGIGEKSALVRQKITAYSAWLGMEVDQAKNSSHNHEISTASSKVNIFVIPTNEELMIARHTAKLAAI